MTVAVEDTCVAETCIIDGGLVALTDGDVVDHAGHVNVCREGSIDVRVAAVHLGREPFELLGIVDPVVRDTVIFARCHVAFLSILTVHADGIDILMGRNLVGLGVGIGAVSIQSTSVAAEVAIAINHAARSEGNRISIDLVALEALEPVTLSIHQSVLVGELARSDGAGVSNLNRAIVGRPKHSFIEAIADGSLSRIAADGVGA